MNPISLADLSVEETYALARVCSFPFRVSLYTAVQNTDCLYHSVLGGAQGHHCRSILSSVSQSMVHSDPGDDF